MLKDLQSNWSLIVLFLIYFQFSPGTVPDFIPPSQDIEIRTRDAATIEVSLFLGQHCACFGVSSGLKDWFWYWPDKWYVASQNILVSCTQICQIFSIIDFCYAELTVGLLKLCEKEEFKSGSKFTVCIFFISNRQTWFFLDVFCWFSLIEKCS